MKNYSSIGRTTSNATTGEWGVYTPILPLQADNPREIYSLQIQEGDGNAAKPREKRLFVRCRRARWGNRIVVKDVQCS
jgi:hypothetical protein